MSNMPDRVSNIKKKKEKKRKKRKEKKKGNYVKNMMVWALMQKNYWQGQKDGQFPGIYQSWLPLTPK